MTVRRTTSAAALAAATAASAAAAVAAATLKACLLLSSVASINALCGGGAITGHFLVLNLSVTHLHFLDFYTLKQQGTKNNSNLKPKEIGKYKENKQINK